MLSLLIIVKHCHNSLSLHQRKEYLRLMLDLNGKIKISLASFQAERGPIDYSRCQSYCSTGPLSIWSPQIISVFLTSRCVLLSLIFWYLAAYKVPSFLLATRYTLPNPPAPIRLRFIRSRPCKEYFKKVCLTFTWPCQCGTPSRPWRRTWAGTLLPPL